MVFRPCCGEDPLLVVTTDGTVLGVLQSGDNGHTVDITLLGTAGPNDLVIDGSGGLSFVETHTTINLIPNGFEYVNENGDTFTFTETITGLVDNGDGSFTYTSEDGTVTTIDVTNSIITPVVSGNVIATHDNGDGTTTDIEETITTIVNNGDGTYTFTHEGGGTSIIDVSSSVVTQTVTAGNEIATHDDGGGNVVSILETVTTLVDNGDGTFTYTSEDGTATVLAPTVDVTDNGDGTITIVGPDNVDEVIDLCAIIAGNCSDSLTDNGDGTYTHVAVDGTSVTIDTNDNSVVTQTVTAGNEIAQHDDGDGVVTPILESVTTIVDNADGSVTYTAEGGGTTVLDFCGIIQDGGCVPSVVPGPNPFEYTFDDGYGNTTVIAVNELDADINDVQVAGSVVTFTSEDGSTVAIDICQIVANNCGDSLVANPDGTWTHTAVGGATESFGPFIVSVVDQGDGTADVTDTAGNVVTLDVCQLVAANCSDSLVVNPDGSSTHTAVDGTVTVIPAGSISVVTQTVTAGNEIATHDDGDGNTVSIFETITSVVDNGDGTASHTSEDGTVTVLDLCQMLIDGGCQNCEVTAFGSYETMAGGGGSMVDINDDTQFATFSVNGTGTFDNLPDGGTNGVQGSRYRQTNAGLLPDGVTPFDYEFVLLEGGSSVPDAAWEDALELNPSGTGTRPDLTPTGGPNHTLSGGATTGLRIWTVSRVRLFVADGTFTTPLPTNFRVLVNDLDGRDYNNDGSPLNDGTAGSVQRHEVLQLSDAGLAGVALSPTTTINQTPGDFADVTTALAGYATPFGTQWIGDQSGTNSLHQAVQASYVNTSEFFQVFGGEFTNDGQTAQIGWSMDFSNQILAGLQNEAQGEPGCAPVFRKTCADGTETWYEWDGTPYAGDVLDITVGDVCEGSGSSTPETETTLVDNGRTFTYTNEAGTDVTVGKLFTREIVYSDAVDATATVGAAAYPSGYAGFGDGTIEDVYVSVVDNGTDGPVAIEVFVGGTSVGSVNVGNGTTSGTITNIGQAFTAGDLITFSTTGSATTGTIEDIVIMPEGLYSN